MPPNARNVSNNREGVRNIYQRMRVLLLGDDSVPPHALLSVPAAPAPGWDAFIYASSSAA
jgi:hypothetical protein